MFNQTSNLVSSHAMSGWVTPHLQSVGYPFGYGSLLNQEASNAFPPFHYWKPCLTEQYYPTAILNFYRYLSCISRKCHTFIAKGIRAVFITGIEMLANYLALSEGGVRFLPVLKYGVSATPAPRRTQMNYIDDMKKRIEPEQLTREDVIQIKKYHRARRVKFAFLREEENDTRIN